MNEAANPVSRRVIDSVAALSDTDPLELPPLCDEVDPDALDALCRQMSEGQVSFRYAGYSVTVDGDGFVDVEGCPAADDASMRTASGD